MDILSMQLAPLPVTPVGPPVRDQKKKDNYSGAYNPNLLHRNRREAGFSSKSATVPATQSLLVFGIIAVALASPIPGHHGHHEHHIIHVPYHVHTVHHHHVKKVHVPVHHVEKVHVPVHIPVHHVEKVPVPVPVHHVEKVHVPVPVVQKVPVPVHIPVHEEKVETGGWW
ncbi:uncharacterized histidine-rich protein DDB_G0274557-like [Ooceraea biroi]|uniref:uncharacterized histidine-rich protein DDB_G0274557-like n=1 Tax=Ooceraea biroi TaxID=2015173 RepID=UPI000F084EEC|nr:uncharacterized histidine-rich protein DDB_G0274557-like [Ooceraea biroi]